MVEPVAALLINVLSPARPKNSAAIVAALKTTRRTPPRTLGPDFFSPVPRRAKGKERAVVTQSTENLDGDFERVLQCHNWVCNIKASNWCSRRHRLLLLKEFAPRRERPYLKPPIPHSARNRHISHFRHVHHQRRYTSRPFSSQPTPNTRLGTFLREEPLSSASPSESTETLEFSSQEDFNAHIESLCEADSEFNLTHADQIFEAGSVEDWLLDVPSGSLLKFVEKTLSLVETSYSTCDLDSIQKWGSRLEQLLRRMSSFDGFEQVHARRCLLARALGLKAEVDEAISIVHQALDSLLIGEQEITVALRAYHSLLLSFKVYGDMEAILDFLIKERAFIAGHLYDKPESTKSLRYTEVQHIRKSLYEMLSCANDIVTILESRSEWAKDMVRPLLELLLSLFLEHRDHRAALSITTFMESKDIKCGVSDRLLLTQMLARAGELSSAQQVFNGVPRSTSKKYLSTALMLAARQGNEQRAMTYFQHLSDSGHVAKEDYAMMLYVYAVQAKVDETIAQFNSIFPRRDSSVPAYKKPGSYHHSMVLFAYAQKGDIDGMNRWLERMADEGVPVDRHIYNTVLHSFAKRGDLLSVISVLNQMRDAKIKPTVITYTMVITLLAHRKDPVGAESIYKRAIREGVVPDRHLMNSLMNAHVEAGSWQGVIRIFDYIRATGSRHLDLTVPIYNTVLKAYVLIGSPFPVVAKLFGLLQDSGLRPDAHTFSLLIQSACDAGEMHVARDILRNMRQLANLDVKVNVYALTILMAGYLRLGDKIRAKEVYDEMQERGIGPTAITFGIILRAYGNERSEESIRIAENFVKNIMETPKSQRYWDTPSYGKMSALQAIYAPLLSVYAVDQKPEEVERLFQEMLDEGGEPDIGILTMLMDAYRRTFNIDAVLQIWPQIFRAGLSLANSGGILNGEGEGTNPSLIQLKTDILCIPLSIYIDALSAAGHHTDIANVWKKIRSFGFTFNSHNWNHLVVALVRAGEPERAFEVVERVILPYQRQAEKLLSSRDLSPTTPLAFDESDPNGESSLPSPPSEAGMHKREARARAVRLATEKTRAGAAMVNDETSESDFVQPLFILHRFSPTWNLWRAHEATLSVLLLVLTRLRTGALIEPVLPEDATDEVKKQREKVPNGNVLAAEMLARIEQNYPETLQLVAHYERKEKRRLKRGFEDAYIY